MNEIGAGCTARETKLNELMQRAIDMSSCLQEARCKLNNLSDRLLGCIPETAGDDAKALERSGAIGIFEDKIDNLKYQVDEMVHAVNRIEESGVV